MRRSDLWIEPKTDWNGKSGECFNIEDWNRIEADIQYLASFYGLSIAMRIWVYTSFPDVFGVNSIKERINRLCEVTNTYPLQINEGFKQTFQFNDMNTIEGKLLAIYESSLRDTFKIKKTGAFSCGQSLYLPGVMI